MPTRQPAGQRPDLTRRFGLAAAAALATAMTLAGCGFELRRAPELQFSTVALTGFSDTSLMSEALRRHIASTASTRVAEGVAQAQVVLEASHDARERVVVASTSAGQVREIQVRARLRFSVRTAAGKELIPSAEILQVRDMTYNERNALAKEKEEESLYQSMVNDISLQVLRRLAALKPLS